MSNEALAEILDAGSEPVSLAGLFDLAKKAEDLSIEIEQLELLLKGKNSELHNLRTSIIPDAMAAAGAPNGSIDAGNGLLVSVGDFVNGSLPKDPVKRDIAIAELTRVGGEALIKTEIKLQFEKSEMAIAKELLGRLRQAGYAPELRSDVHPQTLMAFVREKIAAGEDIAYEKVGCFVGRIANITRAGAKKTKGKKK